jgi:epoxyqueuosine reductase QueG
MATFNEEISGFLREQGVELFGFADLSEIPAESRHGFPRGIVFAFPARREIIRQIVNGPTPEYHREYKRLNELLRQTGKRLEAFVKALGFEAMALEATVKELNRKTLATRLPHKTSATLAGLGWIGKSALLVTEKYGSAMRLNTVLTDLPLLTGKPVLKSKCGRCKICFMLCPAKAITGRNWKRGMKREELLCAFRCRQKAQEQSNAIGAQASICGICIANCPKTKKYLSLAPTGS